MHAEVDDRLAEDARAEVLLVARDLKVTFDVDARDLPREVLFSIGAAIDELDPLPGAGLPLAPSGDAPLAGADALVQRLNDSRERLARATSDLPMAERLAVTIAICELGRWRTSGDIDGAREAWDQR